MRSIVYLSLLIGAVAHAADPPASAPAARPTAPASTPAKPAVSPPASPRPAEVKPLDLHVGKVRDYMTPKEYAALLDQAAEDDNTVIVKANAPLLPMRTELDVSGGILAPYWAIRHPKNAWRIFLPDPRIDVSKMPPPDIRDTPPPKQWER